MGLKVICILKARSLLFKYMENSNMATFGVKSGMCPLYLVCW